MQTRKGLYLLQVSRTGNVDVLILTWIFFSRLSRHPSPGTLSRQHHSSTVPMFIRRREGLLINKINERRNIDPAAGNANLETTAHRQTKKTASEICSLLLYGGAFWDLFVFSMSMGHGDPRAVFRGESPSSLPLLPLYSSIATQPFVGSDFHCQIYHRPYL